MTLTAHDSPPSYNWSTRLKDVMVGKCGGRRNKRSSTGNAPSGVAREKQAILRKANAGEAEGRKRVLQQERGSHVDGMAAAEGAPKKVDVLTANQPDQEDGDASRDDLGESRPLHDGQRRSSMRELHLWGPSTRGARRSSSSDARSTTRRNSQESAPVDCFAGRTRVHCASSISLSLSLIDLS